MYRSSSSNSSSSSSTLANTPSLVVRFRCCDMWHARAEKAKTSLCITTWGSLFLSRTPGNEKFRSNGRAPYAQKNLRVKKKQKPVGQSSQKTAHPSREQMYICDNCGRKLQNFYIRDPVRFFPPCVNRQKTSAREATTKQSAWQASCKSGGKKKMQRVVFVVRLRLLRSFYHTEKPTTA